MTSYKITNAKRMVTITEVMLVLCRLNVYILISIGAIYLFIYMGHLDLSALQMLTIYFTVALIPAALMIFLFKIRERALQNIDKTEHE